MAIPFAAIGAGLGALGSLFKKNTAVTATQNAALQNQAIVKGLEPKALGYIDAGQSEAKGYLEQAGAQWAPLASLGQKGTSLYADALGINGAAGNANATSAFQAGPGYGFQMDQGLQALERRAAAQGRLQSGQTGLDTLGFSQGLASQEYGGWLDRLGGFGSMYQTGLAGQAGSLSDLASLATGTAGQRVDLSTGIASALMGSNNQVAAGKESNAAQRSSSLSNIFGGFGNALGQLEGFNFGKPDPWAGKRSVNTGYL